MMQLLPFHVSSDAIAYMQSLFAELASSIAVFSFRQLLDKCNMDSECITEQLDSVIQVLNIMETIIEIFKSLFA